MALALELYFNAVAAREAFAVAQRSSEVASALRTLANAQAEAGVGSRADAIVAEATAIEIQAAALAAQQRFATSIALLASALGEDPAAQGVVIDGALEPLAVESSTYADGVAMALETRPELSSSKAEQQAALAQIRLLERTRLPNPTIAFAARNDWIGERTIGLELSVPVPLPSPVGQTNRGQIDEARALAERKQDEIDLLTRRVRVDLLAATNELVMRRAQVALYNDSTAAAAESMLQAVTEEIAARTLPLRDALIMERALLGLLFGRVEAQRQLCSASVQLAHVSGQPFVMDSAQ